MDGPSFSMLRDLPRRPTQRLGKLSSELDAAAADQDLACFQGSKPEQELVLSAFQSSWERLLSTMKELQQHTMAGALEQLQQWSAHTAGHLLPKTLQEELANTAAINSEQQQHPTACSDLLPTVAFSLASSTNTAEAYAHLLCSLKQQGHPTALVSARELGAGTAAVINSALRQFLGSTTPADDMPALLAWWKDELQHNSTTSNNSRAATGTPCRAAAHPSEGAAGSTPMDVDKGHTAATPRRQLRSRAASTPAGKTPGAASGGRQGGGMRAVPHLQVPVLVLQDADGVDAESLEELVVAMYEARQAGLPLVLVLGIMMSHHGLLQLLPNNVMRRVQLLQLSLPPARQQLARLCRAVMLTGPQPHVMLGRRCAAWLLEHFRDVDASASTAQRAMQLACVEHFLQQPLSCLAPAAASGTRRKLQAAIKALPRGQLQRCFAALAAAAAAAAAQAASFAGAGVVHGCSIDHEAADAAAADARQRALAHLQVATGSTSTNRHGGQKLAEAAADAAAVLEGAVWAAMTAFQHWRAGLLMLSLAANFTGAAEVDASYQLPAMFAAAQQPTYLTVSKQGVLSPCGRLLFKLLGHTSYAGGSSRSSGSSWPAQAKVVPVDQLSTAECEQLLQKLLQLLKSAQPAKSGQDSATSNSESEAGSSGSSSSDESDDGSGSSGDESDGPRPGESQRRRRRHQQQHTALAASQQVQQLVQALEVLHQTAAAAVGAGQPGDQQQQHHVAESGEQGLQASLASFCSTFADVLTPLPEQRQAAAASAPAAACVPVGEQGDLMDLDAAMLGAYSTPAGVKGSRAAAGSAHTPQLTPGGLASQLRKRVRFAPETPDHVGAKAAGASSSAKSTPDDAEAAPGLIKTPNKRGGSSSKKSRKKLFDGQAAAAAAAAAAADAKPRRSSRREKQQAEVGDIAGSSTAALAAVAAAAAAGGGTAAGNAVGNKRHARLMGLMANSFGASSDAAAGGGDSSPAAVAAGSQQQQQQPGLLLSPIVGSSRGAAVAAGCSPEGTAPSSAPTSATAGPGRSRLRNSSNSPGPASRGMHCSQAAAAAVGEDSMMLSPARGRTAGSSGPAGPRSTSRLSRRSAAAAGAAEEDAAGGDVMQQDSQQDSQDPQQQQQQDEAAAEQAVLDAGGQASAGCVPESVGVVLACLLNAAIPKLLLDWSHPSSSDSKLYQHLSSTLLSHQNSGSGSSGGAGREAAVAAGTSLAAAGAAAFMFDDVQVLEQRLSPAAPAATHTALVVPGARLPGHPISVCVQGWEDTCLAYVLLQQQRDDGLPVSDWFGLFCQALGLKGFFQQGPAEAAPGLGGAGTGREAAAGAGRGGGRDGPDEADAEGAARGSKGDGGGVVGVAAARALRSRARAGRKARGYADARAAAGDTEEAGGAGVGSNQTPSKRGRKQQDQDRQGPAPAAAAGRKRGGSSVATAAAGASGGMNGAGAAGDDRQQCDEVDQQELLAAAARFSQAAAELQLLGVWKGTKRRRAAGVLRVFAPEGPELRSMAIAAATAAEAEEA